MVSLEEAAKSPSKVMNRINKCGVGAWIAKLSESEQAAVATLLLQVDGGEKTLTEIAEVFRENGLGRSEGIVRQHRRKLCSCPH